MTVSGSNKYESARRWRERNIERKRKIDRDYKRYKKKRWYMEAWIERYLEKICQCWTNKRLMALVIIKNKPAKIRGL